MEEINLEELWRLADEHYEANENLRDQYEEEGDSQRTWYHDGWMDAMRWLMDVLEEGVEVAMDTDGSLDDDENMNEW